MIDAVEFATNFPESSTPPELRKLVEFDSQTGDKGFYAEGFELAIDDKGGLKTWSTNPDFLARLSPFAQATGGGSFYALWSDGTAKGLSEAPVIVFGDEGGTHVVAENVRQLLVLLTLDSEPMVDFERVTFYRDPKRKPSAGAAAYRAWLKAEFHLEPIDDAEALVSAARTKHQAAFEAWMSGAVGKNKK
jgi:hypothetical protein